MDRTHLLFASAAERVATLLLAAAVTFLVLAAINAGFAPHGAAAL